jgi:arylsulfatase
MKIKPLLAVLVAGCTSFSPAFAQQQTTGTLGSPAATTTIDGQSLPAEAPPFGGVINLDAKESTAWWPPTVVPPKGAPNVLLIMTDDAGYGVSGTFGGVIPTPTLDQIAADGLRFTQFHSTALCSPTRGRLRHDRRLELEFTDRLLEIRRGRRRQRAHRDRRLRT